MKPPSGVRESSIWDSGLQDPFRSAKVKASGLLDSPPQREFDELARLAADVTGCEIALISLLDDDRQWFKATHGTTLKETPISWSFCSHAIQSPGRLMIVEDATADARVCDNPLVTNEPGIRAYMGMPLCAEDGTAFGTLCVIELHKRSFSEPQRQSLRRLAMLGEHLINTAVRAAEAAWKYQAESELEMQRLVMMLTYGIDLKAYIDREGCYRYVNKAFVDKYGCPEKDIVGQHVASVIGELAYQTEVEHRLEKAFEGNVVTYLRLVDYPIAGLRWMEASLFPVQSEDGQVSGVVVRARDVHDLVVANQKLKERAVSQEQFIAVLAHDVREPLRTIRSFISLAIHESDNCIPKESVVYLDAASRGAERLSRLVNGLLEFLQADGRQIPLGMISLKPVLIEVMDDLKSLFDTTQATVSGCLDAKVYGNQVWLRVCLQNLITNAVKFARPEIRPIVEVTECITDTEVEVRVIDNGRGIHCVNVDQIFEPFVRLPSATGVDGAGLGLSLCRRISALHSGSLEVERSNPQGTTFLLKLPRFG